LPAFIVCILHAYRPAEIIALADSLDGGHGTLLTLFETGDAAWAEARALENFSRRALPRLRPWGRLWPLLPSGAFLLAALLVPQRVPTGPGNAVLANDIAEDLKTTLSELKKQDLVTPAEEKKLEEEIERIRPQTNASGDDARRDLDEEHHCIDPERDPQDPSIARIRPGRG